MIRTGLAFCLTLVLLTSGCFLSRDARVNRLKSKYPQWDQGTIEKVADRQVEVGMTEEMVRAGMGRPWSITHDGDVAVWEYSYYRTDPEGYTLPRPSFFINFRNGRVTGTQGDRSKLR